MHADHVVLAPGRRPGGPSLPWLVHGTSALPLRRWPGRLPFAAAQSVTSLLADWPAHAAALRAVTTSADTARLIDSHGIDVRSLTLEPPVRPGDLVAAEVSGLGRQHTRLGHPREELPS